jgi:hypothetical protein
VRGTERVDKDMSVTTASGCVGSSDSHWEGPLIEPQLRCLFAQFHKCFRPLYWGGKKRSSGGIVFYFEENSQETIVLSLLVCF